MTSDIPIPIPIAGNDRMIPNALLWPIAALAVFGTSVLLLASFRACVLVAHAVRVARRQQARGYGRTLPALVWEVAVAIQRRRKIGPTLDRLHGEIDRLSLALDESRRVGDETLLAATSAVQQLTVLEGLVTHGEMPETDLLEYGGRAGLGWPSVVAAVTSLSTRGTVLPTPAGWDLRKPVPYVAGPITGASLTEDEAGAENYYEADAEVEDHIDLRA